MVRGLDVFREYFAGRKEVDGLPWVGEDRLIALKASAWLDLGERVAQAADRSRRSRESRHPRLPTVGPPAASRRTGPVAADARWRIMAINSGHQRELT